MDSDDVPVVYDDEDDKVTQIRSELRENLIECDKENGISTSNASAREFEGEDNEKRNEDSICDIYEDLDDAGKDNGGTSEEEEELYFEGIQSEREISNSPKSKTEGIFYKKDAEIHETDDLTERDADDDDDDDDDNNDDDNDNDDEDDDHDDNDEDDSVVVNSHLKEIVDIKNQIRELQDILHDKSTFNAEKSKYQDVYDNTCEEHSEKVNSNKKVSQKSAFVRSSFPKQGGKNKFGKMIESGKFSKRGEKLSAFSDRLEDKAVSLKIFPGDKKKVSKANKIAEEDATNASHSRLFRGHHKKKTSNDSGKSRNEKKTKNLNVDAVSEESAIDSKLQEIENIPPLVTSALRKILQMNAHTAEEKYKVLDARDKLYKIMRDKDPTVKIAAMVGTCPDMCPEKERLQRESQSQVSIFEMFNYPKNTNMNHNIAVKRYCRSSADQEEPLPHELRPVNVLTMTISYLLHNIVDHCELSDDNLEEWYMFMWDRTRALRKELTQQGVCDLDTVNLVEQCARFHIHCAERLVDQDSSIYDDKINTENLTKCLQTLKYMYKDLAKEDTYCANEPEFVCYSMLLNLNNSSVFTEFSNVSERLMSSEPVRFALDIMIAWETRNYIRFFKLINGTTYLNCCLLRRYFNEMRLYAVKTMIRSYCTKYHSPQISIYRFIDNLSFDGIQDCREFLTLCNFDLKMSGNEVFVDFNRMSFRNPENPFPIGRSYLIIEEKKRRPLSVIMAGGELPAKTYENHVPQNSFSANGELKLDSLLCQDLMEFANASPSVAIQPAKNKALDSKLESLKASKDSNLPLFSDGYSKERESEIISDIFNRDAFDGEKVSNRKPLFSKNGEAQTNIFAATASFFEQNTATSNIFNPNYNNSSFKTTNIFGSKEGNAFSENWRSRPLFGAGSNIFGSNSKSASFLSCSSNGKEKEDGKNLNLNAFSFAPRSKSEFLADGGFKFKLPTPPPAENPKSKAEQESAEFQIDKLEKENAEKGEEARKEKERSDDGDNLLKKLEEENRLKDEAKKIEKEKMEAEEKRKARERLEEEERKWLEEVARQERKRKAESLRLLEIAKKEEAKRKLDADLKLKVDNKMSCLKNKYILWKTKEFFNKWRLKTWITVEDRKMKKYFEELQLQYPPICTDEHLNGNPHGLIIPNTLILQNCRSHRSEENKSKKERRRKICDDLSLIDLQSVVCNPLEARVRRLGIRVDPFLWKVIVSVPDEAESKDWREVEAFVEVSLLDKCNWLLRKKKGPLYYCEGCRSTFRYKLSVRRVRGRDLYEGAKASLNSTAGSNGLIFVLLEEGDLAIAKERLRNVILSRRPLPQIPVVVFAIGENWSEEVIGESLNLKFFTKTHVSEYHVEKCSGQDREQLALKLATCFGLAAQKASPTTGLKVSTLSEFGASSCFESIWRRIETSLSDYKIVFKDPNLLIECYNSNIEELVKIVLENENESYTTIGDEFAGERPERPTLTESYRRKLTEAFELLKLPPWPREIPKTSHQLKHRIHQYCKKVSGQDKNKTKELKWLLYGTIRKFLLWRGLDIYCDEDIDSILLNFPWIQMFQEISHFIRQESIGKMASNEEELTVVYRLDKVEQFGYENSFISKLIRKSRGKLKRTVFEGMDSNPRLEHDSVIFAYSAALERERNKRKNGEVPEPDSDDVFQMVGRKRKLLDGEEWEEEEAAAAKMSVDVPALRSNIQGLSDRLDELKRKMDENAQVLKKMQTNWAEGGEL